jgi:DNA/RNA endonuclease YhcR with UshA esterase domain
VEGTVVRTFNSGKAIFLNFAEAYEGSFTAVIFPEDVWKFPAPPENLFYGKRVRIRGLIEDYQGTPEIVIEDPWQIEVALTLGQPIPVQCNCPLPEPTPVSVTITLTPTLVATIPVTTTPEAVVQPQKTEADPVSPPEPAPQVVSWSEAAAYNGQTIIVEGQVVDTYNSGKVVFLNFAEDFRNTFKVAIFPDAWPLFPTPPEEHYKNKIIQVTGQIQLYQNVPEIIVDHPDQIKIVE